MKLSITGWIVGCMTAALLAGCGGDNGENESAAKPVEKGGEVVQPARIAPATEKAGDPQLGEDGFPITRFPSEPWIYKFEPLSRQDRDKYLSIDDLFAPFFIYHTLRPWHEDTMDVLASSRNNGGDLLEPQGLRTDGLRSLYSEASTDQRRATVMGRIENALEVAFADAKVSRLVSITLDPAINGFRPFVAIENAYPVHMRLFPEGDRSEVYITAAPGAFRISIVQAKGLQYLEVDDPAARALLDDAVSRKQVVMKVYGQVHSLYRGKANIRPSSDRRVQVQPHFIDLIDEQSGAVMHTVNFD